MKSEQDSSSAKDLVSKIAAGYSSVPMEDRLNRSHPPDEELQNPELDRAFDELVQRYGTKHPRKVAVPFPNLVFMPTRDAEESEGANDLYECPECGHANPGENQFCGKCGAEHGEITIAPARRVIDEGFVALNVTSSGGIKHFHHHYHHYHYRSSPYLILSTVVLLAVMAWHAGWDYGLLNVTRPSSPKAVEPKVPPVPREARTNSSPKREERKLETIPALPTGAPSAKRRKPRDRSSEDDEVVWFRRPPVHH